MSHIVQVHKFCCTWSYPDDRGKAQWKVFPLWLKIVVFVDIFFLGYGIYNIIRGIVTEDQDPIEKGAVFFGLSLMSASILFRIGIVRYGKNKKLEFLRDEEEQSLLTFSSSKISISDNHAIFFKEVESFPILNKDVLAYIFSILPKNDLLNVSLVCKRFYELSIQPELWNAFLKDKGIADKYCGKEGYIQYMREKKEEKERQTRLKNYQIYNDGIFVSHLGYSLRSQGQ